MKREHRIGTGGASRCAWAMVAILVPVPAASGAAETTPAAGPPPRTIELWPQGAPGARGTSSEDRPAITVFLPPPERNTGAGIVLWPGGGFTRRCEDHEGTLAAEWLRAHGVAAFVVRYRVVPIGTVKDALDDSHRAMRYVRAHAAEWGVSPRRLGTMGFSAGATLAAALALQPRSGQADAGDPLERLSSRPDFMVLAYGDAQQANQGLRGVSALGLSTEEAARIFSPSASDIAAAPPAFLFCTAEDAGQIRGMTDLYSRLVAAERSAEAHFFAFGEHGVGFAVGDPVLGHWPEALVSWMRTSGFLVEAPRVAVRGRVTLDGEPLPRGSVVLTPLAHPGAPIVVGYVFGTTEPAGEFAVRAERGPVPGRYRVEVRQDATRWASNSRDPVLRKMQQRWREAAGLTSSDVEEWVASARSKDFSPSIENQRVFGRRRPTEREDLVVEIRPEGENKLEIDVSSR